MTRLLVATAALDPEVGAIERNTEAALAAVRAAAEAGAQLCVLPEMWPTSFVPSAGAAELDATERAVEALRALTAELDVTVVGSAFGPMATEGRAAPTNRAHVLARGELLGFHDKVHLFSPTAETLAFRAGDAPPPVVTLPGTDVRIAPLVCYDLRFPEVARAAFRAGAELLAVCAQWPAPRAPHLRALLAGRAAELEGFVVAANRTGHDVVGRRRMQLDFDASTCAVVGPAGEAVAPAHTGELENSGRAATVLSVHAIDVQEARDLRRAVPVARDARDDLFRSWLDRESAEQREA